MRTCRRFSGFVKAFVFVLFFSLVGHTQTTRINFDVDAHGHPIIADHLFIDSTPLTTEYSSLGVTFAGDVGNNGGSIIDDESWLISAASGRNFLAFNRLDTDNAIGGQPIGPETLLFSRPISSATILAYGSRDVVPIGPEVGTFLMEAFSNEVLVDTATATHEHSSYAELGVFDERGIDKIVLTEISGIHAYVYDDLTFTIAVPASLPGDFDTNGVLDLFDMDDLLVRVAAGENPVEYDLNNDTIVDSHDIQAWVKDIAMTWIGDVNLDGRFGSGDLIEVFKAGQFEDTVVRNSDWATGDWNGDLEFDTSDLVFAFQDGGYENGPRNSVHPVPEPSSSMFLILGLIGCVASRNIIVQRQ